MGSAIPRNVITSPSTHRQIVFPTARPGPPSRTLTTTAYSSLGPATCSPSASLHTAVGVNLGQSKSYPMFPLHGAMAPLWLRVEATMPMEDLPPLAPCSPAGQLPPCCPVPSACRDPSPPRPPLSSCNTFFCSVTLIPHFPRGFPHLTWRQPLLQPLPASLPQPPSVSPRGTVS